MSTRSCTTICDHESRYSEDKLCALYRHHDGYLGEAGAKLAEVLAKAKTPTDVAALLMAETYEATSYRPAQRVYELTTSASDHGDLEHEYRVHRKGDGWRVVHRERRNYGDFENAKSWKTTDYTLAEFVAAVNADRRAMNARLDKVREQVTA